MSIHYAISARLFEQYNRENIIKILKNGSEKGCIYFPDIWPQESKVNPLSLDEAASLIQENLAREDELPCLLTQIEDTLIYVFIKKTEENNLIVTLTPLASMWVMNDSHGPSKIDFARYIKVLLGLINGFSIEHLESIAE